MEAMEARAECKTAAEYHLVCVALEPGDTRAAADCRRNAMDARRAATAASLSIAAATVCQ